MSDQEEDAKLYPWKSFLVDPGAKHDNGKAHIHSVLRYFPRALEQVARVSEFGATKHGWDTWHTIPNGQLRYADAQMRHELDICKGETHAQDSGLLHLSHEVWNSLARLELLLREQEDDRK